MAQVITRRTPKALPDVPEDVVEVHLAHLNDPNYPFDSPDWSEESFEYEDKKVHRDLSPTSSKPSEFDVETQSDYSRSTSTSNYATSRGPSKNDTYYDDESPYPEVRGAVPSTDDPSMPVNTFRSWFLGLVFAGVVGGLNQFFSARRPAVFLTSLAVQIVSLPAGKALEYILPTRKFKISIPFTRKHWVWCFNPGPFNIKEHVLITVMTNSTSSGAYATEAILAQHMYYAQPTPAVYQIFLVLGSQLIGFSFAGIARRFLVWPSAMIWPAALVNCTLFTTLHRSDNRKDRRHISRQRFFMLALLGAFIWYWIPGYLFTALSMFNWVCWIAPQNGVVNTLFGTFTGLGMGVLTFDWSMIAYVVTPLATPWWAQANVLVSLVLWFWILAPIIYFSNTFYAKFLPMSAPFAFDNTGRPYRAAKFIVDNVFDADLYRKYSPIYLPTTFLLSYGLQFAAFTATITHVFLWYRRDLMRQLRRSYRQDRDIHSRLMAVYPEVPDWWFATLGLIAFVMSLVAIEVYKTGLPVWGLILSIFFSALYIIPGGMIEAVTNQSLALNVISEVIGGFLVPGQPVALMLFKTFGTITMVQAVTYSGDLKLGHYMKIPPKSMFFAQVIATIVTCLIALGVQAWQLANIADFCSPHNKTNFTCPNLGIFNTAAVIWGGIGAERVFGRHALWFFLVGALLPIPFYFAARRWPTSYFKYVNLPVFFAGVAVIPPASGINIASWGLAGFIFQYWMRRRHFRWWMRFNYILSAALDTSVAFGSIAVFFFLQLPKGGIKLDWWGNTVWQNTADAMGIPLIKLAPGETFGPVVGQFS